ncbi:MAG: hypothetical protein ACYTGZ_01670 [Planctomycetota bacterium]
MERALGEVPNVKTVYFEWRGAIAWVRFEAGKTAEAKTLAEAVTKKTPFSGGPVLFVYELSGLPDELP